MRSTFRLTRIFGIDIDMHVTFLLLVAFFGLLLGWEGFLLIVGVFFFVTIHELCHGLAAAYFGIKVKRITLLPIGGVASMSETPEKPYQELIISIAGPLSNVLILFVFYYPLRALLGKESLMYPFLVLTGQAKYTGGFNVMAHIYWINLVLAGFNILPAFPMDGGRALRAILSYKMGFREATKMAVKIGHIFALLFAYMGMVQGHILLIVIAVFIYTAASTEGLQVDVQETIKSYYVKDVLAGEFAYITSDTPLSKVMELILHTHQQDFPVIDGGKLVGMIAYREVIQGMQTLGKDAPALAVMRKDIPPVKASAGLNDARAMMRTHNTGALPVIRNRQIVGVITVDDISKIYTMMNTGNN